MELRILFNTSMKNLVELSGRIDVQQTFKLLKSKKAVCDSNNGAIKKHLNLGCLYTSINCIDKKITNNCSNIGEKFRVIHQIIFPIFKDSIDSLN